MKFRVTMKNPDTLSDAIEEAVKEGLPEGLEEGEKEDLIETRKEKAHEMCGKWFQYGEYLTVEVDTEAMTCTVVERR